MCGIAGAIVYGNARIAEPRLTRMIAALTHRGPDGVGTWISADGRVGLGHRRLSIIDLSALGAQPMHSASGRYVISFNGEIYNFAALRAELSHHGYAFKSHSDTEVILAGCDVWGIQRTIPRLAGMFALAIWDAHAETLSLVRDRVGIKPLYYTENGGEVAFASELRALVKWRGAVPQISRPALREYLRLGYVPGPLSIFEDVHKLAPASIVEFSRGQPPRFTRYWDLAEVIDRSHRDQIAPDETQALALLDGELRRAVASHMVSDVPLGAFLSGGIDSSTVVAMMQAQTTRPVKTFSIGFREAGYNEAEHAAAVARSLGTDHTELYVTEADARAIIPKLADIYDEPFADSSQIPTFLVCQLARRHVTVALSGDGGDELFAGYNRYLFVAEFWRRLKWMPRPTRRLLARALTTVPSTAWDTLFHQLGPVLPKRFRVALPGQKIRKAASVLEAESLMVLHRRLISQWDEPERLIAGHAGDEPPLELFARCAASHPVAQQMYWDMNTYLVDDILTKVDRASMAIGLEARVPLLDHALIETAWRVPMSLKLRAGGGKWILKQLLYRYVPRSIVDRPKMGFSVPIDEWLRGPLREWAEENLASVRLQEHGMLNDGVIRHTWHEHLRGAANHGGALWAVLMFQIWMRGVREWV